MGDVSLGDLSQPPHPNKNIELVKQSGRERKDSVVNMWNKDFNDEEPRIIEPNDLDNDIDIDFDCGCTSSPEFNEHGFSTTAQRVNEQKIKCLKSLALRREDIPVLGYWKIRGFVQPIRLMLAYLQHDFQDKWYEIGPDLSRESWLKEKFTLGLELPNLPYWIDKKSDVKLTQSRAILRHLARENYPLLLGQTNEEKRRVDMLENHIWDCWTALVSLCFSFTEPEKEAYLNSLPAQFELLENFIGDNKWCTCDHITYADFMVYETLYQHKVFSPTCLDKFPRLKHLLTQIESIPSIAEYMKSSNYISKPLYTRLAKHYI